MPSELKEWAENTAMGTFAGMLYCGGRQFVQNRREGAETMLHGPTAWYSTDVSS